MCSLKDAICWLGEVDNCVGFQRWTQQHYAKCVCRKFVLSYWMLVPEWSPVLNMLPKLFQIYSYPRWSLSYCLKVWHLWHDLICLLIPNSCADYQQTVSWSCPPTLWHQWYITRSSSFHHAHHSWSHTFEHTNAAMNTISQAGQNARLCRERQWSLWGIQRTGRRFPVLQHHPDSCSGATHNGIPYSNAWAEGWGR